VGRILSISGAPKKIAVLGGGISALSAVFDLTSEANWQKRYDITIYQLGWRLGGKGASSRNPNVNNRIEEHGLHIWLGFYENAFEIMRKCYAELKSGEGPFDSWDKAFRPHSFVVLEEITQDGWLHWPATFPVNDSLPGDGRELPSLWDYIEMILELISTRLETLLRIRPTLQGTKIQPSSESATLMSEELTPAEREELPTGVSAIRTARRRIRRLKHKIHRHKPEEQDAIHSLLNDFSGWSRKAILPDIQNDTQLRRAYIPIDLLSATAKGVLHDRALSKGLDSLDEFELRDWLGRHGASQISLNSAWLRGAYDLAFSYEDGDPTRPNIAAGVSVRSMFRMVFTYRGAILWKMQAGMGETVFTPLYQVLRRRGVKFQFFHRVDRLTLSPDKLRVQGVEISRQATVRGDTYDPLISVRGLLCWRHQPDYDQLAEGDQLRREAINLESFWTQWQPVEQVELKADLDFDEIILGIPIAALKTICVELSSAREDWRSMFQKIKTIQTQGFQLWLTKSLSECGWKLDSPVLGAYVEPLDTWADMSHLLSVEDWAVGSAPKQLAYFCGVMKEPEVIPPPSELAFPAQQALLTGNSAREFLAKCIGYLWPSAALPIGGASLDWNVLFDQSDARGEQRFQSQYWRANIDPSERYVLAVAGSTQFRLKADQSGFSNLTLAGDWLRNGLNTPGCIESAVLSGRQAGRAIAGRRNQFIGESDFPPSFALWRFLVECVVATSVVFSNIARRLINIIAAAARRRPFY